MKNIKKYSLLDFFVQKLIQSYLINQYDLKLEGLDNHQTSCIFAQYDGEQIAFKQGMKSIIDLLNNDVINSTNNLNFDDSVIKQAFISGMKKQIELLETDEYIQINQDIYEFRKNKIL